MINGRTFQLISVLTLFTFASFPVLADSFRCNNKVVKTGDTSTEVKLKCGQPFNIEYLGSQKKQQAFLTVERYTYVPKTGKLIKILEFHAEKLVKITEGPRA